MKNFAVLALLSVGTVQAVTDAQLASAITVIENFVPEDNSGLRDFAGGIVRLGQGFTHSFDLVETNP
jgi:hypothetical protein